MMMIKQNKKKFDILLLLLFFFLKAITALRIVVDLRSRQVVAKQ